MHTPIHLESHTVTCEVPCACAQSMCLDGLICPPRAAMPWEPLHRGRVRSPLGVSPLPSSILFRRYFLSLPLIPMLMYLKIKATRKTSDLKPWEAWLQGKLGLFPTMDYLETALKDTKERLKGLSQRHYDPKRVYITFNSEQAQRRCLKEVETGMWFKVSCSICVMQFVCVDHLVSASCPESHFRMTDRGMCHRHVTVHCVV